VLANYANKQYLITVSKGEYNFINVSLSHSNNFVHLFGFLQKIGDLCVMHNNKDADGIFFQRMSLNSMKDPNKLYNSQSFSIKKLS
jgi:hypothetical protein